MKVSVVTPSIRKEGLQPLYESLSKQLFYNFEWLVCSPFKYDLSTKWIEERPKREGDFWGFTKALNDLFKLASGDLIITIMDSQYVPHDTISKLYDYYRANPRMLVCGIGNGYIDIINGQGINMVWYDGRRDRYPAFAETNEIDFDTAVCSIPRIAIYEVGGMDEEFDKVCCFSDREMIVRIRKLGYKLYLDPTIDLFGRQHTKEYAPGDLWSKKFKEGEEMYDKVIKDVDNGRRLRLNYL